MFVIKDKWIPRPSSFSLLNPPFIPDNMRVAELKNNNGEWNEALVRAMLDNDDAEAILAIPTSGEGQPDVLRWHFSKDGEKRVSCRYEPDKCGELVEFHMEPRLVEEALEIVYPQQDQIVCVAGQIVGIV